MNLIVCCTPLQMKIAEHIINEYRNEKFISIVLINSLNINSKYQFYINRLSEKSTKTISIDTKIEKDRFKFLWELINLKCEEFIGCSLDKIFFANINSLWIQTIISKCNIEKIYTFDDGLANIIDKSPLIQDNNIKRKLVNFLVRNKFSSKKILKLSQNHFTIYRNMENIIPNTVYIDIFKKSYIKHKKNNSSEVSILIGQPVFYEEDINNKLIKEIYYKYNLDHYFPHPREICKIDGLNYIYTDLIFEDYISSLQENKIIIYSFFSSIVINLINFSNIDIRILKIENTRKIEIEESYKLLAKLGLDFFDKIDYMAL
ncbi:glycosyltransferase family 52 [Rodentibacter pneumotropicus]|uniref:glycosyltransferase family 52 n=2 Tax=Rodentibacter pneumotropicus TaxID=758 RepID=UPI00036FCD51|nr:glycosyltransferase family 52 [Rodentibacter pneumotropicus]